MKELNVQACLFRIFEKEYEQYKQVAELIYQKSNGRSEFLTFEGWLEEEGLIK